MKIDYELVRNILLDIEASWDPGYSSLILEEHRAEQLPNIEATQDVIVEHVLLLIEAGFLRGSLNKTLTGPPSVLVSGITWEGHEFINNARNDTIWEETKQTVGGAVGTVSLSIFTSVIREMIREKLGM